MKNLITLFLIVCSAATFAQDSTQVQEASVKALAKHNHLVLFIGKNYDATTDIQTYMQKDFDCRVTTDDHRSQLKNGDILFKCGFIRSIPGENKQTPINFAYLLTKDGIIKKVTITGDRVDLAELFLFYWPTTVTPGEIKQRKVAEERLISDRIVYQAIGDKGLITITHL